MDTQLGGVFWLSPLLSRVKSWFRVNGSYLGNNEFQSMDIISQVQNQLNNFPSTILGILLLAWSFTFGPLIPIKGGEGQCSSEH